MRPLPILATIIATLAVSTAAPFILLCGVEAFAIAAWRLGAVALVVLPIALRGLLRDLPALSRRDVSLLLLSGLLYGVHFCLFTLAFWHTSKESAVMLLGAQPLLAALAGLLFLGERVTRSMAVASVVSIAGLGLFVGSDYRFDPGHLGGDIMVLASGVAIVLSYTIGRRLRPKMSLTSYLATQYVVGGLTCLAAAIVAGQELLGYGFSGWYYLGWAIVVPTLLGHSLFHYAVKYVPVFYVNLAVLGEPILAIVIMIALAGRFEVFRESALRPMQLAGGLVLLAGVAYGLVSVRKRQFVEVPS